MVSLTVYRTKLLLWDQSPSDKEVVVSYDGDSLHTFLLDLDNVAGASAPALGKVVYCILYSYVSEDTFASFVYFPMILQYL